MFPFLFPSKEIGFFKSQTKSPCTSKSVLYQEIVKTRDFSCVKCWPSSPSSIYWEMNFWHFLGRIPAESRILYCSEVMPVTYRIIIFLFIVFCLRMSNALQIEEAAQLIYGKVWLLKQGPSLSFAIAALFKNLSSDLHSTFNQLRDIFKRSLWMGLIRIPMAITISKVTSRLLKS